MKLRNVILIGFAIIGTVYLVTGLLMFGVSVAIASYLIISGFKSLLEISDEAANEIADDAKLTYDYFHRERILERQQWQERR